MDDNEMKQRREGFMTAVGLLLDRADPAARDSILEALKSTGDQLDSEIASGDSALAASEAGANPCPPGMIWDPVSKMCVVE